MNGFIGTEAPVSKECAVGDDYCLAIIVDCTKEDVVQRLVLCKDSTTKRAEYYGCAKDQTDKWCPGGT